VKLTKSIQFFLGVGLLLLSISHWFPLGLNVLELLAAFAHFTLVLSWLVILIASVFPMPIIRGFAIISSIVCAFLIAPHFKAITPSEDADLSVGQFNLYHHNPSPETALEQVQLLNADIISIHELNSEWAVLVDSIIRPTYPYSIEESWEHCCYGTGFYSKFPIVDYGVRIVAEIPVVFALLEVNGQLVRVVSFHALTPVFPNQTSERNEQ
jgi:endonuclease/exonuclease/phosphatase (EEP) superfamily protein YafD